MRIKPSIPDAIVYGHLYSPDELGALDEDMVEIVLPGEKYIHLGWFPPHDPQGEYQITSYVGQYDTDKLITYCTRDFAAALSSVVERAIQLTSAAAEASEGPGWNGAADSIPIGSSRPVSNVAAASMTQPTGRPLYAY
jgi:hypothetical protein